MHKIDQPFFEQDDLDIYDDDAELKSLLENDGERYDYSTDYYNKIREITLNNESISLKNFAEGEKIPKKIISRNKELEREYGIEEISCIVRYAGELGMEEHVKLVGEVIVDIQKYKQCSIFFMIYNDIGEMIGYQSNLCIVKRKNQSLYPFSLTVFLPKNELVNTIRIRPVVLR